MAMYARKPMAIDAFQWTGNAGAPLPDWFRTALKNNDIRHSQYGACILMGDEGAIKADIGDYIILDEDKIYFATQYEFEKNFELVKDELTPMPDIEYTLELTHEQARELRVELRDAIDKMCDRSQERYDFIMRDVRGRGHFAIICEIYNDLTEDEDRECDSWNKVRFHRWSHYTQ